LNKIQQSTKFYTFIEKKPDLPTYSVCGDLPDDYNYSLIIPKFHVLGTIDVRVPTLNKDLHILKKEKITQSHYLEDADTIAKRFRDFFLLYAYVDTETKFTKSFVDIYSLHQDDDAIYLLFEVVYSDGHIPFPIPAYSIEDLEEVINELERENSEKSDRIEQMQNHNFRLQSQITAMNDKIQTHRNRLNRVVLQQYRDSGKQENCPVCFISIPSEKLVIPDCCHFICHDCSQQCTVNRDLKCPICREISTAFILRR